MHQYINEMKEHEFVLWVIGANAKDKGKFVYEIQEKCFMPLQRKRRTA